MSTYSNQYKDPRWQKKRLEIMERDEFQCQKCGDEKSTLNVHHIWYEKGNSVWEYDNNALITLCESCHESYHNDVEYFDLVCRRLKRNYCCHTGIDIMSICSITEVLTGLDLDSQFFIITTIDGIISQLFSERRRGYYEGLSVATESSDE